MRNKIIKYGFILIIITFLSGCASSPMLIPSRPIKPQKFSDKNSILFRHSINITRKAAMFAATSLNPVYHKITKSEPYYIEIYAPPQLANLQVGIMGGETVGIWLEPLGENQTRVMVNTAKSKGLSYFFAEQQNYDEYIIDKMKEFINKKNWQ